MHDNDDCYNFSVSSLGQGRPTGFKNRKGTRGLSACTHAACYARTKQYTHTYNYTVLYTSKKKRCEYLKGVCTKTYTYVR